MSRRGSISSVVEGMLTRVCRDRSICWEAGDWGVWGILGAGCWMAGGRVQTQGEVPESCQIAADSEGGDEGRIATVCGYKTARDRKTKTRDSNTAAT